MRLSLTKKQQEAYRIAEQNTITLYGGAIRGGKSYWLLLTIITYCFKYPNSRWLIVRESLPTLKRTILQTFQSKFLDVGISQYVKEFNQQTMTVTMNNGSQIIFMSENYDTDKELNRFRGLEINGAGCDEVNELHEDTFNKIIERSGSWTGATKCPIKILLTCNPSVGWVKKVFYERWVNGTLPDGWAYVSANINDNPYISDDYKKSLKLLPSEQYKIFVEGDWNAFQVNKPFAYAFDYDKHVGKTDINKLKEVYLSFDFNVDPITCIAAQHYDNKLFIVKEFGLKNSDIYELCTQIKTYLHNCLFIVTGDATGQNRSAISKGNLNYYQIIQQELLLNDNQMQQPTVNPAVADTRVLLNAMLQNYQITIDGELCPMLIQDLRYVEVDEKGDIKKDRSTELRKADFLDCQRYLLSTFFSWFLDIKSY